MVSAAIQENPSRGRLLVVDDDPSLLRSMRRTLTVLGYDVATAPDVSDDGEGAP